MMTPLPPPLQFMTALVGWRVDEAPFASSWDSGTGAERAGGRWNPVGVRAVYGSFDPATSILEVAAHKGFRVLDTKPHVITSVAILDASDVRVVLPDEVPNPAWLHGGIPSAGQQAFGAHLLRSYDFLVIPSAISRMSWNIVFDPRRAAGKYARQSSDRLVIDTRLNPP